MLQGCCENKTAFFRDRNAVAGSFQGLSEPAIYAEQRVGQLCRTTEKTCRAACPAALYLGVAQLAARVIWDHEAGSSTLPTQTIGVYLSWWHVSKIVRPHRLRKLLFKAIAPRLTYKERRAERDTYPAIVGSPVAWRILYFCLYLKPPE